MYDLDDTFKEAIPILRQIIDAGFEAYFVGGSVRDTLLKLKIHDVDIATSAYPEEIKKLFKKTVDTGIQHGTVMVLKNSVGYELTTFRTETGYQDYRRPDAVTFVRSLKDDLKRRDFTINALAMDVSGKIIDLFNGKSDLNNKIIRAVGNPRKRFHEDALRMMRAVRFASQLDFRLEDKTRLAIKSEAFLLKKIAIERIHVEFIKLLLGKAVKKGLREFLATDLYQYCPSFIQFRENLLTLEQLDHLNFKTEAQCWVIIGYIFKMDPNRTKKLLKEWKSSRELINEVALSQNIFQKILTQNYDEYDLYQSGKKNLKTALSCIKILNGSENNQILEKYEKLPIKSMKDLKISGKDLISDLKMRPGKNMGVLLKKLEREVLFGKIKNNQKDLLDFILNQQNCNY